MIADLISKLQEKTDLSHDQMNSVMTDILSGNTSEQENVDFLSALTDKGETDDELLGMLDKMQQFSLKIRANTTGTLIDMCGTGGDNLQTFNVSTAASFVVASAGGLVAKHGNRSVSGVSGSADIFEYLGYDLSQDPSQTAGILERHRICFMFAQRFHPAMRHVAQARRRLGRRTAFNLLGPLSNPAQVKNQMVGVFSIDFLDRLPKLLSQRGAQNVMAVRSDNGMDELSTSATNRIATLRDGKMLTDSIDPEALGLHKSSLKDIQVETKRQAVESFVRVLNNTANRAMIETVALNAAGGLVVANVASSFEEAIEIASSAIQDGRAFETLKRFVQDTGDVTKLEEIADA